MATPRQPELALLVVAAFSRHPAALEWAQEQLQIVFGPVIWMSLPFDFNQTQYYTPTMGPGLRKQFLAFERLVPADILAEAKLRTNDLEARLAESDNHAESRPLNLDPGLLTLGKFMLATTKDQAHRIYLRDGIFAEVTLRYHAGSFEPWPWTYADYRQPFVRTLLKEARELYRGLLRQRRSPGESGEPTERPACAAN
jgi:hypothetical protein